jgi:ribosomal protein S18 acetylase RimI-like enzyme
MSPSHHLLTIKRTFLEMRLPPTFSPVILPPGVALNLVNPCKASFYRYLYTEVGKDYYWFDRLIWSPSQTQNHLNQPEISIWVLTVGGNPAGFFELKQYPNPLDPSVEIAYLGLLPEFIGQGLGKSLLTLAIERAWQLQPKRVWLHTCSLDHPHALKNYQQRGFKIIKEEYFEERRRSISPEVLGLFITPESGEHLISVTEVEVRAGRGIVGDRYFSPDPQAPKPGGEITLIEQEALTALGEDYKIHLEPSHTRRNVLTQNIALNHLVGNKFNLGDITLKGIELCEPCGYLEKSTQKGVRKGLIHRGGLRAKILSSGILRVGDRFSAP